ncbi:hypothetical protein [Paraburkholderia fungorum]|uniref:hypothetical protein n=2 Tax=Paraburkholderia TaxID=1822464 RepID=UPI00387820A7
MTLPANSYLCWDHVTCEHCGSRDRPMGYNDNQSSDFYHACQKCGHRWVAITAEEERAAAEERMKDALSTGYTRDHGEQPD